MVLICMQEAIIKKSDTRVKAPKGTTVEKKYIKKKRSKERGEKKERCTDRRGEQVLGQLGAIEGHR